MSDEENLILQYFLGSIGVRRGDRGRVGAVKRKLSPQIPSPKKGARFSSFSNIRIPLRGERGAAGSRVARGVGALIGLKVGALHTGRGFRTQAPAGLGTCLWREGAKRLRLPARVPRID